MQNPWELSRTRHFNIHPDDEMLVKQHNRKPRLKPEHVIERGLPPLPYLGNPRTARVILLMKNSKYSPEDETEAEAIPQLADENVKSLTFESDFPFFYLAPNFAGTAGYAWWDSTVGDLLNAAAAAREGMTRDAIAGRIACLQSHPYRSRESFDPKEPFPTQAWTDFLAGEAAARPGVVFVVMGGEPRWREAVPNLKNADLIRLRTVRRPSITPGNMAQADFDRLVKLLAE